MKKMKVLFLCGQNTARSQIAEAFMNKMASDRFIAESAGLEPGPGINPLAARVMREVGIDIFGNSINSVTEFFEQGRTYDYVIAVCDEARAASCPIFPGAHERISWPFDDIGALKGEAEEVIAKARVVRDNIRSAVEEFIENH